MTPSLPLSSSETGAQRAFGDESSSRPQSGTMAPLPLPETISSSANPLTTSEVVNEGIGSIKHRWVIVLVLLVVLAAVGVMIAIALTSSPTT